MKIEAGKCYRTRDGRKVYIYRTDAHGAYAVHGSVDFSGCDYVESWTGDGSWSGDLDDGLDLVAPWVDEPTMDISALPAWATHVVVINCSGDWYWAIPGSMCGEIPKDYSPKETAPPGSRYRIDRKANRLVLEEGGAK